MQTKFYKNQITYNLEVKEDLDRVFLNGEMNFKETNSKEIIPVLAFALINLLEDSKKFQIPVKEEVFYFTLIEKLHKVATKQF
jgi:hypothetical protein